jgi:hypothetical protein
MMVAEQVNIDARGIERYVKVGQEGAISSAEFISHNYDQTGGSWHKFHRIVSKFLLRPFTIS